MAVRYAHNDLFVGSRFLCPLVVKNRFLIPENIGDKRAQPQRGGMFIDPAYPPRPKPQRGDTSFVYTSGIVIGGFEDRAINCATTNQSSFFVARFL